MKKALLVTHVSGFVPQFEMNNVRILQNMGYEIHYASNYDMPSYGDDNSRLDGTGIIRHQIDFARSPYNRQNAKAYRQLLALMQETHFDLVHCHTPMGGALARLAAHRTHTAPVIYTVHGFHFFAGAPLLNWLIYYPVERFLSRYTDMLITINQEDYQRAGGFHAKQVRRIHGVGIQADTAELLDEAGKQRLRQELDLPEDCVVLLSAGELNDNKNQMMVLKAMKEMADEKCCYLMCGKGPCREKLAEYVKNAGLEKQVRFLGYRKDLKHILQIADIFVMPSKREGMPTVVMEAMAYGLPVVGTDIRGNNELIEEGRNGYLVPVDDEKSMAEHVSRLAGNEKLRMDMGRFSKTKIEQYSSEVVENEMLENYKLVTGRS